LILEQGIVGMVVKLLNQANEHICDIIKRAGRLTGHQRRNWRLVPSVVSDPRSIISA